MFELITAFGLDLVFGDPIYQWHPVRILGGLIQKAESWLRKNVGGGRFSGLLLALFIPALTFISIWLLCELALQIHPFLKSLLTIYIVYSAIAVKDLVQEGRKIYAYLVKGQLDEARKNLSRIVGRDTEDLSEDEVIRGAVEALAESFVDGILSPLFFAAIGGAPLAMAYKAVNTLDSIVGHQTPQYREFGFFSAKLDELVNWIPARISWLAIGVGAFFVNERSMEAWRIGFQKGASKTSNANSVVPEAAFAGALGVQLGGTNYYQKRKVETPKVGYPVRSLEKEDIRRAYHLVKTSAWAALGFALLINCIFWFISTNIVDPIAL